MLKPWLTRHRIQLKTPHAAIISLGAFIGLCYLPTWLRFLVLQIPNQGSGSFTLAICLTAIGCIKLWQQRYELATICPLEPDRWLGNSLIIIGILLFPFCRFTLWSQALSWLFILSSIALSCWGLYFFRARPGISLAFTFSVYPNPGQIGKILWQTLLPTKFLESSMAWLTTVILQWLGQPVIHSNALIHFPDHNIEVGWGCSGFDMALAMTGAGLLIGLYLEFSHRKIIQLIVIGISLALLVNIPRLVLMSLAAVYWGNAVFEFWHGPLGGQVFVILLMGGYYYCISRFLST